MEKKEWFRNCRKEGALSLQDLRTKIEAFSVLYDCFPTVRIDIEFRHGVLKTVGRRYLTVRVAASEWRKAHDEKWLARDMWYVTIRQREEATWR